MSETVYIYMKSELTHIRNRVQKVAILQKRQLLLRNTDVRL